MVCIIDDREDVWSYASNLIHVKPYHFFQHTGDINAPPGLDKHEDDDKEGVDLTRTKAKSIKVNGSSKELDDEMKSEHNENQVVKEEETKENDCEESKQNNEKESISEETEEIKQEENIDKAIAEENIDKAIAEENMDKDIAEEKVDKDIAKENLDEDIAEENDTKENMKSDEKEEIADEEIKSEQKENSEDTNKTDTETGEEEVNKNDEKSNNLKPEQLKSEERKEEELIEIEDPDDYLLYLEEILKIIHKAFYEKYDKLESGEVPDLKKVIPEVRGTVLKGTRLVFSGLVPTHIKLEQSKAYQVARSLGATVTQDLEEDTTHLVAVRPGTAKVNVGRRKKSLKIVTPDWLWSCAERWERVEEKLYPLNSKGSKNRHPPPHCSSPEHVPNFNITEPGIIRKRTPSGRFMDTINPLMSFSSADIADMDREVEDIFNESESEGESKRPEDILTKKLKSKDTEDESSSSDESLTGEHPHGWNPKNNRKRSRDDQEAEAEDESTADEFPSTKFRRGEELSSDLEFGQESNSEGSVDAPDEIDDGDWNMMGAALEREFLSNN